MEKAQYILERIVRRDLYRDIASLRVNSTRNVALRDLSAEAMEKQLKEVCKSIKEKQECLSLDPEDLIILQAQVSFIFFVLKVPNNVYLT